MNRLILGAVLLVALAGCGGDASPIPEASKAQMPVRTALDERAPAERAQSADTLRLAGPTSYVAWRGTKMWGLGSHAGTVPVDHGYLVFNGYLLIGGEITVDMTAIGVTDIPPDQPRPISILTEHLEDPLFFDVAKYPTARFEITGVDGFTLEGLLTIKDVTEPIEVPFEIQTDENHAHAYVSQFSIDRFRWNVAYEGGFGLTEFSARNFVDRDIELTVVLVPF